MKQRLCGFSVLATVVAALALSAPATAAENQLPFLLGAGDRLQANDDSADRAAKEQARRIEGVWLPIVTITDCQTQAVIVTFPSMEIYVRGGGFVGFGAVQKSDQVGLGAWRHAGGRNYVSQYNFFGYAPAPPGAPDGAPDGTLLKVSATIRLNAAGTAFSSSETADLLDSAGNVLGKVCGTRHATRLQERSPDANFRRGETAHRERLSTCRRDRRLSSDGPVP